MKLSEYLSCVFFSRKTIHNLQFSEFDVDRVVVLAEEDLDVVLEYGRSSLDDQQDIPEHNVLHFGTGRQDRNCVKIQSEKATTYV